MHYLRPFTTTHKWNRIVEIGGFYFTIFTKMAEVISSSFLINIWLLNISFARNRSATDGRNVSKWRKPIE